MAIKVSGVVFEQANENNNYVGPILDDPKLMRQVGVFSLHSCGDCSIGSQVERIRGSEYPETRIWLTEYGDLSDRDFSLENEWKGFSVAAMKRALRGVNQGASTALFWDAFDNYHEHDARLTFYGLVRNSDHLYRPKKRYYAAKQLHWFVRPGSQRIGASTDTPGMMISAFRLISPESLVVVGIKEGGANRVRVSVPADMSPDTWELYVTSQTLDCQRVDTVPVRDGVAEIGLPNEAIFTLVGTFE